MAQLSSSKPRFQLGRQPGQVLLAEEVRARRRALGLTQSELAEEVGVRSNTVARWERGELRPIHPEQLSRVLARLEQSRTRLPTEDARPRRLQVLAGGLRRVELPTQLSSFVGRDKDVVELKRLIPQTRLVTVTGTGGIGKTRLALRIASELSEAYSEGVWFVDLAPVADAALVGRAVAAALGVREKVGHSVIDTLGDVLHDRQLLLVLDNCEHLVRACAELVHVLLSRCPGVHILATSREALGVPGEVRSQLLPLEVPTSGGSLGPRPGPKSEAERLFEQRALAALPSFAVTERNAAAVAEVCRRLDGIPLALELAAGLVPVLAVEQIAARLDDRFGLLSTAN